MEKKNTGLIILVVVLSLLVLGLGGFIVYDKMMNKKEDIKTEEKENNIDNDIDEKVKLKEEELKKLETYINKIENNSFILMNYSKPEYILTENNVQILKYSINGSEFSKEATEEENIIIFEGDIPFVDSRVSSFNDINLYIKEKTNHEISSNMIQTAFSNYFNENLNLYVYLISDSNYEEHKIIDGYISNNEIHITLDNNSEVVLIKENDKYYFYSCNRNQ